MTVGDLISELESLAPLSYAEDFDNVGLLVGHVHQELSGILVTLDTLEEVVEEARQRNCNCIVSFHPIIFRGLKQLTASTYVERTVMKAIEYGISIVAVHTALDNSNTGVSDRIGIQLGLKNRSVLIPKAGTIKKLTTYVPEKEHEGVRQALFAAGGGEIGKYSDCSFNIEGTGTFKGDESSNPAYGAKGVFQEEAEIKLTMTFQKHLESGILKALFSSHPYEEVAYEIVTLENHNQTVGMGMIGELNDPMEEKSFLSFVKEKMNAHLIRHSGFLNKKIKKVAVLGGSGSFAIGAAKRAGADAFISADFKYHDFFQAEKKILLMDIGHYESEQFTKSLLVQYLKKKIPNFAILLSDINTNPIKYF